MSVNHTQYFLLTIPFEGLHLHSHTGQRFHITASLKLLCVSSGLKTLHTWGSKVKEEQWPVFTLPKFSFHAKWRLHVTHLERKATVWSEPPPPPPQHPSPPRQAAAPRSPPPGPAGGSGTPAAGASVSAEFCFQSVTLRIFWIWIKAPRGVFAAEIKAHFATGAGRYRRPGQRRLSPTRCYHRPGRCHKRRGPPGTETNALRLQDPAGDNAAPTRVRKNT